MSRAEQIILELTLLDSEYKRLEERAQRAENLCDHLLTLLNPPGAVVQLAAKDAKIARLREVLEDLCYQICNPANGDCRLRGFSCGGAVAAARAALAATAAAAGKEGE